MSVRRSGRGDPRSTKASSHPPSPRNALEIYAERGKSVNLWMSRTKMDAKDGAGFLELSAGHVTNLWENRVIPLRATLLRMVQPPKSCALWAKRVLTREPPSFVSLSV